MANKPISSPLPANLPENWTIGQTVAPTGAEVGLGETYGYNYLMEQVNAAQAAVNTINNAFEGLPSQEDMDDLTAADIGYTNPSLSGVSNVKQALDSLQESVGDVGDAVLTYGEQTVQTTAWTEDATLQAEGYGYRAAVPLEGMTADHVPTVNFSAVDATSGSLAPLADSYAGGVYIFAKAIPEAAVTIVSVEGLKGGNSE